MKLLAGPFTFTLRPHARGFYTSYYHPQTGRRIQLIRTSLEALRTECLALGEAFTIALTTGLPLENPDAPTRQELAEFRAWKAAQAATTTAHRSATLKETLLPFLQSREQSAGRSARYIPQLKYTLNAFARHFGETTPLHTLTAAGISLYLASLPGTSRHKKNTRVTLITFSRWARKAGHLPDQLTAAELTDPIRVLESPIGILTPGEYHRLLQHALQHTPRQLPWLLLGGWAGLRTDEIFRHSHSKKSSIAWDHLRLQDQRPEHPHGLIYLPAEVTKQTSRGNGLPRYIPLTAHLHQWLHHLTQLKSPDGLPLFPTTGPIYPGLANPSKLRWIPALNKILGRPWPKNALRHSYGTYRCAALNSTHQSAREMGNSETIIRRHYDRVAPTSQATDYFHHTLPPTTTLTAPKPLKSTTKKFTKVHTTPANPTLSPTPPTQIPP